MSCCAMSRYRRPLGTLSTKPLFEYALLSTSFEPLILLWLVVYVLSHWFSCEKPKARNDELKEHKK